MKHINQSKYLTFHFLLQPKGGVVWGGGELEVIKNAACDWFLEFPHPVKILVALETIHL